MLGRRKFGQQGWSRSYSFNTGDLRICADVCETYVVNSKHGVPWDDLRYIFGEIMYGGHITDPWDRRTNRTYLQVLLRHGIFEGQDMVPCREGETIMSENENGEPIRIPAPKMFEAPIPKQTYFHEYTKVIENKLPSEAPVLFGMHSNAEIGYLTNISSRLFSCVVNLESSGGAGGGLGGGGGGGGDITGDDKDEEADEKKRKGKKGRGGTRKGGLASTIDDLLGQLPENFSEIRNMEKSEPLLETESAPFVVVGLQEWCVFWVLVVGCFFLSFFFLSFSFFLSYFLFQSSVLLFFLSVSSFLSY